MAVSYEAGGDFIFSAEQGVKFHEYLLIITPDDETCFRSLEIKNSFKEYDCYDAVNQYPHISLINFVQFSTMEETIVSAFEKFAKSIKPFSIKLNGFGGFNSQTIFINVVTKTAIVSIVKNIKGPFEHLLRPIKQDKPHFFTTPHLSIARNLNKSQYTRAWADWQHKEFKADFHAFEMVLLKKEIGRGKYNVVKHFPFGGGQGTGEQLQLAF